MTVSEVKNPTPIEKDIERRIEERLFNGFNNWNGGYDGWLEWCNTLYCSPTRTTTCTATA